MDDFFHRRKQHGNQLQPPSDSRYHQSSQEVLSQAQQLQNPASTSDQQRVTSTGGRVLTGSSGPGNYGGYYQESAGGAFPSSAGVSQSTMGYSQSPTEYAQDARQAHGFANTYSSSGAAMMYDVQQAGSANTAFDTTQPFVSRQHGDMQMLATGVTPSPYYTNEAPAAGTVPMYTQGTHGSQGGAVYQHHTTSFGSSIGAAATGSGSAAQPTHSTNPEGSAAATSAAASASKDYAEASESFQSYQRTLKDTFKNINRGALAPACASLLSISDWLLTRVESLGLTVDDEDLYESRVKLWKNFNHAWLGLLAKQKEMMWSSKALHRSQSLISFEDLQKMAQELIRLCDGIERFGLVDYEYGVWEERIMTKCVDLYGMADEEANIPSGASSHKG